ncbi:CD48 antigen-like [Pimephales promelas]|nr:CD48 antigen-like [Pimephales promelas]
MEGDSVTLNTDLTEIRADDDILWKYGAGNSLIVKISLEKQIFTTYDDVPDGRFRDRLKLDDQTGSLTITHTTTEHTGDYRLQISGAKRSSKSFSVSVYARLPVPVIISNSSRCSSSCSLVCSSSVLSVCDATLSWYAGMSVLSSISVCDLSISLSLPLEVEYQDKNTYSCVLNNPISNQTTHLDINTLCRHTCADQTLEKEITYAEPTFIKRHAHKTCRRRRYLAYISFAGVCFV